MAPVYHKPENALKRAEELIAVNQSQTALTLLSEILSSRRNRSTSLSILEPIMIKFVQLCVLLQKGKILKEGLHNYKNITQNTSVLTLEVVIKKFIEMAETQLEEAQLKVNAINLDSVEDLEATETPESLMLSTVSGEGYKERTDKELVTPWFKFLWEAYRIALDTLRNNARLEVLYQYVSNQAFGFCLKYSRKTEFKRLCDLLRQHLSNVTKYGPQAHGIDLNDADTLQRHLDTRFVQLNAATKLELWQEAFRTTEDIHNLLSTSSKPPKPYMMANYYENLARTFMVGDNYLFHAASWSKYYETIRQNKNLVESEHERISSLVLISALAVPISFSSKSIYVSEEPKSQDQRLANLLFSHEPPTRENLIQFALSESIFSKVHPQLKEFYKLLEVHFHPLEFSKQMSGIIEFLSQHSEFSKYVKPLHRVILIRVFQQLSQVYTTIDLDFLVKIMPSFPAPLNYDLCRLEKFILVGCKRGEINIRINHSSRTLTFVNDELLLKNKPGYIASCADQIHQHLALMNKRLLCSANIVSATSTFNTDTTKDTTKDLLETAVESLKTQRQLSITRRLLIEKKKELREMEALLMEREEQRLRTIKLQREQEAERIRLEEEAKKRENERLVQQRKDIERAEAQRLAEKLAKELKEKNIKVNKEELETLDTNKLLAMQVEQLEKEKRDLTNKMKMISKKADHLERAFRKEELSLLEKDYQDQLKLDRSYHEAINQAKVQASKADYEKDLEIKSRLMTILSDAKDYRQQIMEKRQQVYAKEKSQADLKLQEAKNLRLKEHLKVMEEERIAKAKQEEERIKKEKEEQLLAEQKAQAEEQKRQELLTRKAAASEEEEKRKEKLKLQMEKERLAEERIKKQSEQAKFKPSNNAWKSPSLGNRENTPSNVLSSSGNAYKPSATSLSRASSQAYKAPAPSSSSTKNDTVPSITTTNGTAAPTTNGTSSEPPKPARWTPKSVPKK